MAYFIDNLTVRELEEALTKTKTVIEKQEVVAYSNSFTGYLLVALVDEDGNDILVYHARKESVIEGDPLYNPNRHTMLMKIRWENDRPVFSYK